MKMMISFDSAYFFSVTYRHQALYLLIIFRFILHVHKAAQRHTSHAGPVCWIYLMKSLTGFKYVISIYKSDDIVYNYYSLFIVSATPYLIFQYILLMLWVVIGRRIAALPAGLSLLFDSDIFLGIVRALFHLRSNFDITASFTETCMLSPLILMSPSALFIIFRIYSYAFSAITAHNYKIATLYALLPSSPQQQLILRYLHINIMLIINYTQLRLLPGEQIRRADTLC